MNRKLAGAALAAHLKKDGRRRKKTTTRKKSSGTIHVHIHK